jgi:rare lipoprotein A
MAMPEMNGVRPETTRGYAPGLLPTLKLVALLAVGGAAQGCAPNVPETTAPRPRSAPAERPPVTVNGPPSTTSLDPVELPPSDATRTRALETRTGTASFYADKFHNRRTASGIRYDRNALVAAHRTYPFGTVLRVTNLANDRVVTVKVVDRGPFIKGRVLDLSRRAAEELKFIQAGLTRVRIEVLEYGSGRI